MDHLERDMDHLERSFSASFFDALSPQEKEIIAVAIGDFLMVRKVCCQLKITKEQCFQMFTRWQELGIGRQRVVGKTVYFDVGGYSDD